MVCGDLSHLTHGPLSGDLRLWATHSVTVLTRCGLPLPTYILADEKHGRCLTARVYLPTIVCGRVIWHLGYSESKSAAAFTVSYGEFQRIAHQEDPSSAERSPMALTAPSAVYGHCFQGCAWALAYATLSISSRVN